jgi:hypothetical protein
LWSFAAFFPIWYVWTKKNLATLVGPRPTLGLFSAKDFFFLAEEFFAAICKSGWAFKKASKNKFRVENVISFHSEPETDSVLRLTATELDFLVFSSRKKQFQFRG